MFDVVGRENGVVNRSTVTATGGTDGYAQFQLRVPSASLSTTMNLLSRLAYAHVSSRTDDTQDVNDAYVSVTHRLADARALRTALLKQLANAVTQTQIDSLTARIHDAEASIASDEATIRTLNRRINFSQITLSINAATAPAPVSHEQQFVHARQGCARRRPRADGRRRSRVDRARGAGPGRPHRRARAVDRRRSAPPSPRAGARRGIAQLRSTVVSLVAWAPPARTRSSCWRRVPAFSALAEDDLQRVAEVAVPRRFDAGEVVFREGDDSDTCYVVRSGRARAVREHPDGRSITLSNFGPGDIFGELAMFDDEKRSATVETLEDTEVIAILGGDMRRLLREHPDIAVKLLQALGRRLRETNERLARQSFQTVQSRVAGVLSQLVAAERAEAAAGREAAGGGEDAAGADVLITATQADLAQLAGSSRESASRFLAVLERAGVITQGRGKLVVHDAAALERYVY